jgi:hypothetical protein
MAEEILIQVKSIQAGGHPHVPDAANYNAFPAGDRE